MKDRIEELAREMPEGFLWWEGCDHAAGILMEEAIEFAKKVHKETLELAARECEKKWEGDEFKDTPQDCAAAIRKLKVSE